MPSATTTETLDHDVLTVKARGPHSKPSLGDIQKSKTTLEALQQDVLSQLENLKGLKEKFALLDERIARSEDSNARWKESHVRLEESHARLEERVVLHEADFVALNKPIVERHLLVEAGKITDINATSSTDDIKIVAEKFSDSPIEEKHLHYLKKNLTSVKERGNETAHDISDLTISRVLSQLDEHDRLNLEAFAALITYNKGLVQARE